MTPIGPLSQTPETAASAGQATAASATSSKATQTAAKQTSTAEAVTVSKDAVTAAQLLTAARHSDGVDHTAVQSLKNQIQAGTYNVAPDKLAASITTALNGIS